MTLFQLIQKSKNREQAEKLLELLLTEKELHALNERIKILQELSQEKTQRQIAEKLDCSVVTVTRGAKVYNKNKEFINLIMKE